MRTDFKSAVMNIYDSIFFSARKWARRDRWQHELNTACSLKRMHAQYVHTNSHMLHTPSGEFYNSIICFLRHTFSSPPATQHTSISSFSHTLILLASTWEGKMRRSALSDTHTHTHTQKRRCLKATSTLSSTKAVFTVLGGMTHTHTQLKKKHIHTECVPNLIHRVIVIPSSVSLQNSLQCICTQRQPHRYVHTFIHNTTSKKVGTLWKMWIKTIK